MTEPLRAIDQGRSGMDESTKSTVLIVEDAPVLRRGLQEFLISEGYNATATGSGVEALSYAMQIMPDLVLLDIKLPDIDGFEVCRRLRANKQVAEVPIIFVTSLVDRDARLRAFEAGADDFVSKPIDTIELLARVRTTARLNRYRRLHAEQARRQQAEDELGESEERLQMLFETMAQGVLYWDTDGQIVSANPAAERIVGLTLAQMQGKAPIDPQWAMVNQEGSLLSMEALPAMAALRSGEYMHNIVVKIQHPQSGTHRWVKTSAMPLVRPGESEPHHAYTILDDITERVQAEAETERRNRELMTLNRIGQAIVSTLNLQETLTLIAGHTTRLMEMAATSVVLHDEVAQDLYFAAASGEGADAVVGRRLAYGQGIVGWVIQHGEPVLVPDVTQDTRWFNGFDEESDFATRSILCVPLRSKSRIIGALEAINKRNGFDEDDLNLLNALATPVATAIDNARLFEVVSVGRTRLRALSRRLVEIQEAERARVARELHDETGQSLSSLLLNLGLLEQESNRPDAIVARVKEMEAMIDEMLDNLHRLAMHLRPASLDHLGLVVALEQHIETFGQQYSIAAQIDTVGLSNERMPPDVETALYRIVQEALTNVVRHAQATHVDVLVERRGNQVVIIVEDDGIGFDTEASMARRGRLGIFGMRERAEMLGGSLEIESSPEMGTTVFVEVPYVQPNAES